MSALIALGTELAHVCPSRFTSENRSVVPEKGGDKDKEQLLSPQFVSTVAGERCDGLNKLISICLSQRMLQCCHVGRPCTASRPGGGMETQTTRTPSNRRASRPTKNTTAPFQVGRRTRHPVSGRVGISLYTPIVKQPVKISRCPSGQLGAFRRRGGG